LIPVVILIGLALGGLTPRLLPFAVTAGILVVIAIGWGVLVGDPWGVVVGAANGAAGAAVGFLFATFGAIVIRRAR
jgi:hypothetical protein